MRVLTVVAALVLALSCVTSPLLAADGPLKRIKQLCVARPAAAVDMPPCCTSQPRLPWRRR
jgi:hypothetical protein